MSVRRYYSAIVTGGRANPPTYAESRRDLQEQFRHTMASRYNAQF